ncbi:MAG: zf-HC2 domain-containing protein [Bryobacterales bacterium]|nr:zf-HC2 domain-containing protein [Bryobacterales bacterium]
MLEVNRGDRQELTECPLLSGEENAGLLLDYCNHKLAAEPVSVFERHMEHCPACRAFAESQMAVWKALDGFEAMSVSEDFDRRLFARLEDEQQAPWWSRPWGRLAVSTPGIWRPAIPVAAVLLLAAGLWIRPFSSSTPSTDQSVVRNPDHVDAEQVEKTLEDMEMIRQFTVADPANSNRDM